MWGFTSPTKLEIWTPFGKVSPISFKEFIGKIQIQEWPNNTEHILVDVRTRAHYSIFNSTNPPIFKRLELLLEHRVLSPEDITKQLQIFEWNKVDLLEMVCDIVTESANNMGEPKYLVRLSRRLWMAANPEDFRIHLSNVGCAIAAIKPNKSICCRIKRD